MTIGLKLLSSILGTGSIEDFKKVDYTFLRKSEQEIFSFIEKYIISFGTVPGAAVLQQKTGFVLPKAVEPVGFYVDEVRRRHMTERINSTMMLVQDRIINKEPYEAMDIMADAASILMQVKAGSGLVDFRNVQQITRLWHKRTLLTGYYGVKSGWSYLDTRMGGLSGGDVLSVIGRPAVGKTFLLLCMAWYAWKKQKIIPLIVSPEMKPILLLQRLLAMETHQALTPIAKAELTPQAFESQVLNKVEGLADGDIPFWIIDGGDCQTIEDLFLLCRQLKPGCVYYDGAYMMKHKNKKLSKWEKLAETAIGLKELATQFDIPVVPSYQFSKEMVKRKKKEPNFIPGLEDIYGSDEIAQLSSIIVGLLEEEKIDTLNRKKCTLLKGRGGERGQWSINWNFFNMDFSEVKAGEDASQKQLENI